MVYGGKGKPQGEIRNIGFEASVENLEKEGYACEGEKGIFERISVPIFCKGAKYEL